MFAHVRTSACELALLVLFLVLCGCISSSIGEVGYSGDNITAGISNPNEPSDAFVQVTIYQVTGLSQQEHSVVMTGVKLETGDNTVQIPVALSPGTYKLKMYLIQNGERKTAVIRDIVV
jgi:hypothetical protein